MVCFWGVYFCLFWTMGNPGKYMVCFLFVIFLHACFVVPYFVVLRYCGIGGSIVGDFVSMVIMIMMIMMIAISRSRDLGCHDVTMSRSRDVTMSRSRDVTKSRNHGISGNHVEDGDFGKTRFLQYFHFGLFGNF